LQVVTLQRGELKNLFSKALNQQPGCKIACKSNKAILGVLNLFLNGYLADFILKSCTPSLLSNRFCKQIFFSRSLLSALPKFPVAFPTHQTPKVSL